MIPLLIILLFLGGGTACALTARWREEWARRIAWSTIFLSALAAVKLFDGSALPWWRELRLPWIPAFGATFHLGVDGLSAILIALTIMLGAAAVSVRDEVQGKSGAYYLTLLWVLAGVVGVFSALDLLLFFVFWEVMLVPMYFLIALWGHEKRGAAAMKFFIFTQASGLLLFAAIIAVAWLGFRSNGRWSFDYFDFVGRNFGALGVWLMLAFFAAFAVKLPVVPLHVWLPDAHTEAPTAGSVLLAGIMLKTGAYGLLRFVLPLFPKAAAEWSSGAMLLGLFGIFYGALLAFGQRDLKRMVAYTSVSHMGFVLLGAFAVNDIARSGVVLQMVAHGFSTGALFIVVGALQRRLHTRDLTQMGGLWSSMPRLSAFGLFFAVASLGLPGLANFVAEFLILLGTVTIAPVITAFAALGLVAAAVYSLALVQRAFHGRGPQSEGPDATRSETMVLGALAVLILWLGLAPQPLLDRIGSFPAPATVQR